MANNKLLTRIVLRIMVTIVPILIAILSYYIQNKKYIVNEEYYDKMMEELDGVNDIITETFFLIYSKGETPTCFLKKRLK